MLRLPLAKGAVLGQRYVIDEVIAEGGTSILYRGHPLQGAARVAIKELRRHPNAAEQAENLRLFFREYKILSKLKHPGLPHVLELFTENGGHFLIEEYVPGETLQARLDRVGRFEWLPAVALTLGLLDILNYLHKRGIIYRDLKPDNILLMARDQPRLVDFGAARMWRPKARVDTVALGTPGYAAPESYGRAQTDVRTDIYGIGVVLHFMLTGHDPTEEKPWIFADPKTVDAAIPDFVCGAVMRAIELNRTHRFPSVKAMRSALRGHTGHHSSALPGDSSRLGKYRLRLQYSDYDAYRKIISYNQVELVTCTFGLLICGFLLGTTGASVATYDAGIATVTGSVLLQCHARYKAKKAYRTYRDVVVMVHDEGLCVRTATVLEILWNDVAELRVRYGPDGLPERVRIFGWNGQLAHLSDWPGIPTLVKTIVRYAGLRKASGSGRKIEDVFVSS